VEVMDAGENTRNISQVILELLQRDILPNLGAILQDQEPIPLYGIKLLHFMLEKSAAVFVGRLKKQKCLGAVLEFYNCTITAVATKLM
jgi:hypothetical protein